MFRKLILLILCLREIHANTTQDNFEVENRIIGGKRCSVEDHKYMVAILFTDSKTFLCGGTLLSSRWVLTARHCITDFEQPNVYTAVAGVEVPWNWGVNMQMSLAKFCYNHPTDDIGLINLDKSINVSPVVAYVTLATYFTIRGRKLEDICSNGTVVGWGTQNAVELTGRVIPNKTNKQYDPYLQCVNLRVISPQECYKRLKELGKKNVTGSSFCAFKRNADACSGDSGGPLFCNGIQYGIVAYGYGCAYKDYPGIYVKVHHYESFIKATMKEGDREFFQKLNCSVVNHSFLVVIIHRNTPNSFKHVCDGSMLTRTWVLTYGYCTKKCKTPNYYTVVAGLNDSLNIDFKDKRTLSSEVEKCFQSPVHRELWDIALMKLKIGFHPSEKVSFIRFATSLDVENKNFRKVCTNGTLIGYGRVKNVPFRNLQCDQTTVVSEKDCKKTWSWYGIDDQHGCIDKLRTDNCYAALGSPLICDGIQYGVLGFYACSRPKISEVNSILIAKVYKYDEFLQRTIYILNINSTDRWKSSGDIVNNPVNLYIIFILYFVLFLICVL